MNFLIKSKSKASSKNVFSTITNLISLKLERLNLSSLSEIFLIQK